MKILVPILIAAAGLFLLWNVAIAVLEIADAWRAVTGNSNAQLWGWIVGGWVYRTPTNYAIVTAVDSVVRVLLVLATTSALLRRRWGALAVLAAFWVVLHVVNLVVWP